MKIHQLCVEDALGSLWGTADGLSSPEALRRLREFGPNRVEKVAGAPAALRILKEFVRFFSVILWVAAGLAFVAEWSAPGQGMARIGIAIIAVILVSGTFSFWQEHRVEQTLEARQKLLPPQVNLLHDGSVIRSAVDQLVLGDVVLLERGDIVPADCRLIEAFSVRVNNATVTWEAMPQARDPSPSMEDDVIRSSPPLDDKSVVGGQ
jgi:sodium/potassium-transporting ATPase subunit alpha